MSEPKIPPETQLPHSDLRLLKQSRKRSEKQGKPICKAKERHRVAVTGKATSEQHSQALPGTGTGQVK